MKGKVGDGYRVTIPAEIRHNLNISMGELLNISVDGNKIILEKEEDDSEDGLSDQNKSKLQKVLEESEKDKPIWDRDKKKRETEGPKKCSCGNDLEDSKFIINGEYVCKACREDLKDHLLVNLRYQKRLRQIREQ